MPARRWIPVADELVRLGFIDFVAAMRAAHGIASSRPMPLIMIRRSENPARPIDTHLALESDELPSPFGEAQIARLISRLASRNLLCGYLLGLPTGQAIAGRIGASPLTAAEIVAVLPDDARLLCKQAGLLERTPLWYYALAEAELRHQGRHLGDVGGTIAGETLWMIAAHSPHSVLASPPSEEEVASGEFTLRGIVKLGQDSALPPL